MRLGMNWEMWSFLVLLASSNPNPSWTEQKNSVWIAERTGPSVLRGIGKVRSIGIMGDPVGVNHPIPCTREQ